MRYQVIIYFYQEEYQAAANLIERSTDYILRNQKRLKDEWRIFKAYVGLLGHFGEVESNKNFRLGKFLNTLEVIEKDKEINNVHVLIIQFLYYLNNRGFDKIIEMEAGITRYRTRYLANEFTQRTNIFLTFLIELTRKSFDMKKVRYRETLKELNDSPLDVSKIEIDAEIIPFDKIIEIVAKHLEVT